VRWQVGLPPRGDANFAWVQHFIHHLAPTDMALVKLKAARVFKRLDNPTRDSFREMVLRS